MLAKTFLANCSFLSQSLQVLKGIYILPGIFHASCWAVRINVSYGIYVQDSTVNGDTINTILTNANISEGYKENLHVVIEVDGVQGGAGGDLLMYYSSIFSQPPV